MIWPRCIIFATSRKGTRDTFECEGRFEISSSLTIDYKIDCCIDFFHHPSIPFHLCFIPSV